MPRKRLLRLGGKEYEKRLKTPLTRREEIFVKALVSQDGMITQGEAAIAEENGAWSAVVQAEYRRGLASGLYVSRSEVRHGAIDQMDKSQV